MSYRLSEALRVEPLVFGWPAWWCNVAPGTSSLLAFRYQLPALKSYLRNPAAHFRAASDPKLAGGSFVGVPEKDADHIRRLLEAMEVEYRQDCAFAADWLSFNERLRSVASGQTMEPFYPEIPATLGGLVELGYDYDNRPSVSFDEGFAYRSSLYSPSRQGILVRPGAANDARPFYMSTPAVPSESSLQANVAFKDPALTNLLELDVRPEPSREKACERLTAVFPGAAAPSLWLSNSEFAPRPPWDQGRHVRVRYLGHACLLVEHAGQSILVDPLVPQGAGGDGTFGFDSLPERIDLVLITHAHPDHFDLETLVRLRSRVERIAVPRSKGVLIGDVSLKRILQELGYADVVELESGDALRLSAGARGDAGEIVALPFLGEHGDVLHGTKRIYWIRFGQTKLLVAADSACLDERTYARARALVGASQHVFMNIEVDGAPISWPFDALFPAKRDRKLEMTRKCRGSNVTEGLRMLETVQASNLHVYAMGLERWVQRITGPASSESSPRMVACRELLERAREKGVSSEQLHGPRDLILDED
jgi:hypothetical protein